MDLGLDSRDSTNDSARGPGARQVGLSDWLGLTDLGASLRALVGGRATGGLPAARVGFGGGSRVPPEPPRTALPALALAKPWRWWAAAGICLVLSRLPRPRSKTPWQSPR